jgi:hypothetical protein
VIPSTNQQKLAYDYDLAYNMNKIIFPGSNSVTTYTPKDWNGVEASFTLENISFDGTKVHFTIPVYDLAYFGHVSIDVPAAVASGSEVPLVLLESSQRPVADVAWYLDDEPVTLTSVVLSAGTHLLEARITLADGRSEVLEKIITAE